MSSTSERAWKVRRLLAMSPAEVGLRVVRGISHRRGRPDRPRPQEEIASAASIFANGPSAELPSDRVERELSTGVGRLLPGARDGRELASAMLACGIEPDAIVEAGERIMGGEVAAFGWTTIETGETPDWHRDPESGGTWPLEYWADLDFRECGGLGDPRYVWEVNRHHHLVTLARASLISGDDRYAARVWSDIRSWVTANPPLFGINWSSPLEIAIRLMSWAMAVDIIGARGALEGDAATLATSVSLQARHLSDNLSVYASSRNNHLIGEAAGLLAVGAKFPFLRGSKRFAALGQRLVERELGTQVTADGVTREQAFQYQTFVMEFALLSAASAACLGTSLALETSRTVRLMARFLDKARGDADVPPSIGDEDGGRAYELADAPGRQAARAVATAFVHTGEHDRDRLNAADLEPALWLFGPERVDEARKGLGSGVGGRAGEQAPHSSSQFGEAGYFVVSQGRHHGVIDCGPLGYLSIAAHGHADCLSLAVAHEGRWVLVDPGTYCYHRDVKWRDHFRGTAAHNTVSIDGADQSEMLGPFMWGRRARATQLVWAATPAFSYFEGAHDGYVRVSGTLHRRAVLFGSPGYWLVVDTLEGSGAHRVASTFQLAPGFSCPAGVAEAAGGLGAAARERFSAAFESSGGVAEFTTWLPEGMEALVAEGEDSPPRGWVSVGFGTKQPAPALIAKGTIELPATLVTAFVPRAGERTIEIECVGIGARGRYGVAIEVTHPEGKDVALLGEPLLPSGEECFKGVLGFRREQSGGDAAWGLGIEEWSAGGTRVRHEPVENLIP